MSDPVTPLGGRVAEGAIRVADAGPRGMILLRGDLGAAALRDACAQVTGLAMPDAGGAVCDGDTGLLWMSPDEALILLPRTGVTAALATLAEALAGVHHLAADVSDARAVIRLEGEGLREVLARLTPADLHPAALPPGRVRRTRLAQAAAAFWLHDETRADLICFRSVAVYVFDLLANAAGSGPVGHLPAGTER